MLINLLRIAFGERLSKQASTKAKEESVATKAPSLADNKCGSKYENDVKRLSGRYGNLENLTIDISLQDLLAFVPRKRRRTEAYQGLCSYLQSKFNCKLTIKSKKNEHKTN